MKTDSKLSAQKAQHTVASFSAVLGEISTLIHRLQADLGIQEQERGEMADLGKALARGKTT